ncbi:hypothetical protein PGH47_42370 (plasmid) [Streptomyces sp. HUAS 31]|nr:hypothetical protein [Streptomyces sp. HUAS 31]WCE02534.1 hypothetical protein PGH47_42370 [Streptomyces sp. HUAS 31]
MIPIGGNGPQALVLADEPATSRYLPEAASVPAPACRRVRVQLEGPHHPHRGGRGELGQPGPAPAHRFLIPQRAVLGSGAASHSAHGCADG